MHCDNPDCWQEADALEGDADDIVEDSDDDGDLDAAPYAALHTQVRTLFWGKAQL